MRIPRSNAQNKMQTIVRLRSSLYDLERPDESSTGRFGDSNDQPTTTVSDVDIWLFQPQETNIDTEFGDRLQGDLQGLSLPAADVEVQDRVTHGVDEYEVQQIYHLPDNGSKKLKLFDLQKRENPNDES